MKNSESFICNFYKIPFRCGLIVISLTISVQRAKAQHSSICADTNCHDTTTIVYLPCFSQCPITVHWIWRICNGEKEIIIGVMSWKFNDPICSTLTNYAFPTGFPIGDQFAMEEIIRQCFNQIVLNDFMNEYNTLPSNSKYILECPNNGKKYLSTYSTCNEKCIYASPPNEYGLFSVYYTPRACGQECCKITRTLCYNKIYNRVDIIEKREKTGYSQPFQCNPRLDPCPSVIYLDSSPTNTTGIPYNNFGHTDCASFCE